MLHTTLGLCKENHACSDGFRKLKKSLSTGHSDDDLIPLTHIIESNGLLDTIWALRATKEDSKLFRMKFASWCARQVLDIYEKEYPNDKRARECLDTIDLYVEGKATDDELRTADAADAAADAAAAYAGRKDMRQKEQEKLIEMLNNHKDS